MTLTMMDVLISLQGLETLPSSKMGRLIGKNYDFLCYFNTLTEFYQESLDYCPSNHTSG